MKPEHLAPNLVEHFYLGGPKIAALRGVELSSDRQPEEWVAATVGRTGEGGTGLACTQTGDLLRDLVVADPTGWTGRRTPCWPGDVGMLLKLLDAGQRLPVHVHPDRVFAARHLDCAYGKTEAWYVLGADADAAVYLGWRADVDPVELARRREAQDGDWMLEQMHRVPVRPGDGILVPARTPHAIGEGVFVAEAQEPTDFSILLEWSVTTSGREDSHLGLGFGTAMGAVAHDALPRDRLEALRRHTEPEARADESLALLPDEAASYFRLDAVAPANGVVDVRAGFAALVVLSGEGDLEGAGDVVPVAGGQVLAVPAAFGDWCVRGDVRLLLCRPGDSRPPDG